MEDSLSVKSNESLATSDDFDFVSEKSGASKSPTLNITNGNIYDMKKTLSEVLRETVGNMNEIIEDEAKKVGQSRFYSPVEPGTDPLSVGNEVSPTEKKDVMKPDCSDEEG